MITVPCDESIFVICKRADKAAFKAYKEDRNHEINKLRIDERLMERCCVWPDLHVINALENSFPFFAGEVASEIVLQSGGSRESNRAKKL